MIFKYAFVIFQHSLQSRTILFSLILSLIKNRNTLGTLDNVFIYFFTVKVYFEVERITKRMKS